MTTIPYRQCLVCGDTCHDQMVFDYGIGEHCQCARNAKEYFGEKPNPDYNPLFQEKRQRQVMDVKYGYDTAETMRAEQARKAEFRRTGKIKASSVEKAG